MKRLLLLTVSAFTAFFVGAALAQVPPLGSGVDGWLQVLYNQLSDGGSANQRTQVTASATGTTAAVAATLPAVANKFTYLCDFFVSGTTSTTANTTAVTVTGTISGSLNFNIQHPVTPSLGTLAPPLGECIQSSAVNTAIVVTSAADAAGSNVAVSAWGYQR